MPRTPGWTVIALVASARAHARRVAF